MGHMGGMFLRGISTIMVMDHKVMDQEGILMGIPQIIFLGTFCVIYAILGTVTLYLLLITSPHGQFTHKKCLNIFLSFQTHNTCTQELSEYTVST